VSYTYDAVGRVISKTIAGQAPFNYTYNESGPLRSVTQGTKTVQMGYDSGGRPVSVVLPSGVVKSYSYDAASRLTGIAYSRNQVPIGDLSYSYDALNRRTAVGGSLAGTVLPPGTTAGIYDAANQLTSWNGTPVSYDANGNMLSDGTRSFTWDARGQLAGISGPVNATFTVSV
jgi:YD repeat-containing protein